MARRVGGAGVVAIVLAVMCFVLYSAKLFYVHTDTTLETFKHQKMMSTPEEILHIPQQGDLNKMDMLELEEIYMRYVENIQQACGITQHMGHEYDGGYHVCEKYLSKNDCLVYSFGSRKIYHLEDEIEKTYGCEIHTFDPFDGQKDHTRSNKITFHSLGIADKDDGKLLRLSTIKRNLNHTERTVDILKIDVEGAEWAALPEIIASEELSKVKLLIVEFHICLAVHSDIRQFRDKGQYLSRLAALRALYNMGFRIYFFRQWPMCKVIDTNNRRRTSAHEVHFMKVY